MKPGWLSTIAGFYMQYKPDLILGPVDMAFVKGIAGRFFDLEFLSLQGVTAGSAGLKHPVMANGANLAFRKVNASEYINFINPCIPSGDDMFLLQEVKNRNGIISWIESKEATVYTKGAGRILDSIVQRARWVGKSIHITDRETRTLSVITLLTNLIISASIISGIFLPGFLKLALCFYIMKSIPDFLILLRITGIRDKRSLLWFFLPSQLLYPLYVISIILPGIIYPGRWKND